MTTPNAWEEALTEAGFRGVDITDVPPAGLGVKVVKADI
jgi:hypothetical protein